MAEASQGHLPTMAFLEAALAEELRSTGVLTSLHQLKLTLPKLREEIKVWTRVHVSFLSVNPFQPYIAESRRWCAEHIFERKPLKRADGAPMAIRAVRDIEESIWSPRS